MSKFKPYLIKFTFYYYFFIIALSEPVATKLEKQKLGYVVASVGKEASEFPYTAFYAKKSYINNNEEVIKKFNKAIQKGMDFTFKNNGTTIAKVIKNQFNDTEIIDLALMIERYKSADVWLNNPLIEEKFFNTLTKLLKDNKLINKDIYYKDLVRNMYE